MTQWFRFACFVLLLLLAGGCAFHRSDFVCGPDGQPAGELSDDGKVLGCLLKLGACVAAGSTGSGSSVHFDP